MSLSRTAGLGGLLLRRVNNYSFVGSARLLRSDKGPSGTFEDKEKATENIYIRQHEQDDLRRLEELREKNNNKATADEKKKNEKKK